MHLMNVSLESSDNIIQCTVCKWQLDRVKRIWYLSHMQAAKVQASLRIRAVSPEPSLSLIQAVSQKEPSDRKLDPWPPLNGWACAVEICHDGMLEDTNSLDGAQLIYTELHPHYLKTTFQGCNTESRKSETCINIDINLYKFLQWVFNREIDF